jgi:di/tricarboxylate transporter
MTFSQAAAFLLVAALMAMFVWGRLRYDLVAMLGLLAGLLIGIIPYDKAFSGFSDDIIFIIASALLVSAAVARSGVIERVLRPISPYLTTTSAQVFALVTAVTVLSGFVKNIGALAMLIPVAFQLARKSETSPSSLLMPMAFGSLLGGIVTLIGTSPNIIVSRVREEIVGEPFQMFDFAPVGVCLALAGILFLTFGWRLLPKHRKGAATIEAAFNLEGYTTEARVPADTPLVGKTVADLEKLADGDVEVIASVREWGERAAVRGHTALRAGDTLLLKGEPEALERIVGEAKLTLVTDDKEKPADTPSDDIGVMEAVVMEDSYLAERTPAEILLYDRYGVHLLAVSRSGTRITEPMRSLRLRAGDVIVLRGDLKKMPETLGELRLLPLAERGIPLGSGRRSLLPVLVLGVAMALAAFHVLPIAIAFFAAAVTLLLVRSLSLKEAYETIEWPILILIGALIPVSDALRETGGTELIAAWLSSAADRLPPLGALTLILVAAMAVTPFLNNAATVLVMGPIAASFAAKLGYAPDPFLMAVAIGAACDFLTPIGHQSNTMVLGPGGYRFADYWRLGLPLSILVVVAGVPLITFFWPFTAG